MLLQRHVQSKHEGLKEVECTQCEYKCGDSKLLKSHVKDSHMSIIHKCLKSTLTFTSKTARDNHLKTVQSDLRPYSCQTCGDTFKMKKTPDTHINNKHSGVNYECYICGRVFKTKRKMRINRLKLEYPKRNIRTSAFIKLSRLSNFEVGFEHKVVRPLAMKRCKTLISEP